MNSREFGVFVVIFGFGLLGVLMAIIEYYLYTNGIILDEMITGSITLLNVQTFTVIFFQLVGVVVAAANS